MMLGRGSSKLISTRNLLILVLVVLGNLSLFFPPYISLILCFPFIAILPGFLFLNYILKMHFEVVENLTFSYFASMIILSVLLMPANIIIHFDSRVASLILVDLLFVVSLVTNWKGEDLSLGGLKGSLERSRVIIILMIFVFSLDLMYNILNKFRIDGSMFVDWDHGIYLSVIIAMSKGMPAINLLRSGLPIQPEMGLFPHFYFYSILLNFTKIPVFDLILFINALTHSLFAALVYFTMLRLFQRHDAALASSVLLSFGSEIYWIIQSFGLIFPSGYVIPFGLYRGTGFPFAKVDSSVNVASVGIEAIAKGFHHLPSLAFCLLFVTFLTVYVEAKKKRYLIAAFACLPPLLLSEPLIFLFFVMSFLPLSLLMLVFQKSGAKRILLFLFVGILAVAGWFVGLGLIASEPFIVYVRYYTIWTTLICLILYFGAPFLLFFLGLKSANVKNKIGSTLLLSWVIACLPFVFFTDLYHQIPIGSWHGYFLYFALQVPWMMFAGLGLSELRKRVSIFTRSKGKRLRGLLNSNWPGSLLVMSILVIGLVPQYQYFNSWVTQNDPYYSYWGVKVSRYELDAYEWIRTHTLENSVFLVSPDDWVLACFTGRPIVTIGRGIPENDQRILDVRSIFTSESLKNTILLLSKYNVSYVFLSDVENETYGSHLNKFYRFTRNFQVKYSNEEVNIIEVVSLETPRMISTSLTVTADNTSRPVGQTIRVSGTLLRNDVAMGIADMTVTIEQFPPNQLVRGLTLLFDEGSGSVCHDSSQNGNDGVIYGASWVHGVSGNALSFDGIDDYVGIADSASFYAENEIKIDVWLSISQYRDWSRILTKSKYPFSDYGLLTYGRSLYFFIKIQGVEYQSPLSKPLDLNTWYHVVSTYKNGDKIRLYVDDEEQGTGTNASGAVDNHCGPLLIGADVASFFSGRIDDLRICTEDSTNMSTLTDSRGNYEFQIKSQLAGTATFRVSFAGETTMTEEFLNCVSPETTLTWTKIALTPASREKLPSKGSSQISLSGDSSNDHGTRQHE